MKENELKA